MTQDIRLTLYEQGLSDGEIARAVGISVNAIHKWRGRRKLPPNKKSFYQPKEPTTNTLCNTCRHAYGSDCFDTPIEDRTWVTQYKVTVVNPGKVQEYRINYIYACERYREQKARVRLSVYQPERMAALKALQGIRGSAIT